jgi:dynein heavy chain
LCKREGKSLEDNVKTLSLGQGQERVAIDAIEKAQIRDQEKWILLQNCHLAKSFMTMLEKKIDEIVETGSSFRLFLTALPSNVIPITIIQDSIKIVNEPPRGLKQSLQRTFNTIDEGYYDNSPKSTLFKRFAFGFVFFHALILERRKYGPLGWNIPYEFSNSDLSISLAQLRNFLEDYDDIQYAAMNYMIAEANYGGRVTDPADRRLIAILFKDICCEDILDDRYLFNNLKDYPVPKDGSYREHEEFINEQIPLNSAPEVFGLNDNADITCAISETNSLFATALLTLPRTVSAKAGASTEDQVRERAVEILKKLPEAFDVDDVRMKHPNKLEESLNSVLHQELMRFNNLLNIAKTSMKNLKDAIDGNAVMTNEIEIMLQSVYDNKTPEKIAKVSYPSMMPFSSWINDFLKKIEFLQNWIDNGIPTTFWISAFYFTHSFLTGILQNYARKYKIPIDELSFEFTVMSDIKEYDLSQKPEDGCYIYGFYIEGARWNSEIKLLDESLPKVLLPSIPHVWFKPAKKDENKKTEDYECPVYRTSKRSGELLTTGQSTNFLIHMYLPFDHEKFTSEHWVKRGTAIICSLNE